MTIYDHEERVSREEAEQAIRFTLSNLRAAVIDLDDDTLRLKELDDFDTLLELLADATDLVVKLRTAVGGIQDRAWALRGDAWGDYHHPSLGVVSVRRTAKRTVWDHEAVVRRIIDQLMEDTEGEIPPPAVVISRITDAGHVDYWRQGKLKEQGIDAKDEDLVWKEPGNPSISFPSAAST